VLVCELPCLLLSSAIQLCQSWIAKTDASCFALRQCCFCSGADELSLLSCKASEQVDLEIVGIGQRCHLQIHLRVFHDSCKYLHIPCDAINRRLQQRTSAAGRDRLKAQNKVPTRATTGKRLFEKFSEEAYKGRRQEINDKTNSAHNYWELSMETPASMHFLSAFALFCKLLSYGTPTASKNFLFIGSNSISIFPIPVSILYS